MDKIFANSTSANPADQPGRSPSTTATDK
jgi:hypothetical protein